MRVGFFLAIAFGRVELAQLLQVEFGVLFVALQHILDLLALFDVVAGFFDRFPQVILTCRGELLIVVVEEFFGLLLLRRQAVLLRLCDQ